MTKENRERLHCIHNILTVYLTKSHITNISDLNTMHYSAAAVLAGVIEKKEETNPTNLKDPDEPIKKKIDKTRKWIGRLSAVKQGSKLTKKVKTYLKKDTADITLTKLKMKLAALTKKLRTQTVKISRSHNNHCLKATQKHYILN